MIWPAGSSEPLTAVAVAISVMAVVALSVVTNSLERSAAAALQMGNADFMVAQKGSPSLLDSVVTEAQVAGVAKTTGVQSAVGTLVTTVRLDASHPQFLQMGLDPAQLAPFGVQIVAGQAYTPTATDEVMLGWQAGEDLHKKVGDTVKMGTTSYRVVGLYSLKQVSGDTASMFPLISLQGVGAQTGNGHHGGGEGRTGRLDRPGQKTGRADLPESGHRAVRVRVRSG
jgi:hypothetical protein